MAVTILKTAQAVPLVVDLDEENDVLYISWGEPVASFSEEKPDGVLLRWRYADQKPSAVTVVGYHAHWAGRAKELCALVANHLDVPPSIVKAELRSRLPTPSSRRE